jgi:hypothetical protein
MNECFATRHSPNALFEESDAGFVASLPFFGLVVRENRAPFEIGFGPAASGSLNLAECLPPVDSFGGEKP